MKEIIKGEEWLNSLPSSTKDKIEELKKFSKDDWKSWYGKVKEKELLKK